MGDVTRLQQLHGRGDRSTTPSPPSRGYIDFAKSSPDMEILAGGGCDDSKGYFIEPTVVLSQGSRSPS